MVDVISVHPGHYFTMVKLADGKIKGFGRNYSGELGYGNNNQYFYSAADKVPAVDVGNSGIISQVSSGGSHICILDSALFLSQVKCWGLNNMGQLGLGDINNRGNSLTTIPSKIEYVKNPAGITPIQIACGGSSTCILYNDNSVRCFGHGNSRGYSTTKDLTPDVIPGLDFGTNFIPKSITSGSAADHTCAISTNNNLKCWGSSNYGQCGNEDRSVEPGLYSGTMGDNLPIVNLGTSKTVKMVSVNKEHTCVILNTNELKCFGNNSFGQLGYENTINYGTTKGSLGDNLPVVNLGTGRIAIQVSCGYHTTCALLDNSGVKCWGFNYYGQLGLGDSINRGSSKGQMGNNLPYVHLTDLSYIKPVSIYAGSFQACVLFTNKRIKCWGYGAYGALGSGQLSNIGQSSSQMGDSLKFLNFVASTSLRSNIIEKLEDK